MTSTTPTPGPSPTETASGSTSTDPWERFGWIMGAIWLVFLVFPIVSLITSDEIPMGWRVGGVVGILLFAATYVRGFIVISNVDDWPSVTRAGIRHLGVMVLLMIALSPGLGPGVLSMLPYVVALGMFSLPLVWALSLVAAALALCIAVPLATSTQGEFWFFTIVVAIVSVSTGLVRIVEQHGHEHRAAEAELALAAERDRVARDVHDVLGHSLTVVTVKAELAQRLIEVDPARAHDELDQIQALSRAALAEIRATVSGLRVANLADEVEAACVALTGAGIDAKMPTDLSVVNPRHRVVLAWALREAVTNVVRHSGATTCRVELSPTGLRVIDDGRGTVGHKKGNGLRGVGERVAAAGGTITLTPGPAGGTILEVAL